MLHAFKALLLVVVLAIQAGAAQHQTRNFIVTAPTQQFAVQVAEAAEVYRKELAVEWLGEELPGKWFKPCRVNCRVGSLGAGGTTTFSFHNGEVFGWDMSLQGTEQRILDSVLPHEITHTIFACHFREALPRWCDEGGATIVEHESERRRQIILLSQVMGTSQQTPLQSLLCIEEYPKDISRLMQLYAQGFSLSDFLVSLRGKRAFIDFMADGKDGQWEAAFRKHYAFNGLSDVERQWGHYRQNGHKRFAAKWCVGGRCVPCPQRGPLPRGCQPVYPWQPQYQHVQPFESGSTPPPPDVTTAPPPPVECEPEPTVDGNALWEALERLEEKIDAIQVADGKDGKDGISVSQFWIEDNQWFVKYSTGNVESGEFNASVEIDIDELAAAVAERLPENHSGADISKLTDEQLDQLAERLPAFFPMWIDHDGNVIDEIPGGIHLGETLPLRLTVTQERVKYAGSK